MVSKVPFLCSFMAVDTSLTDGLKPGAGETTWIATYMVGVLKVLKILLSHFVMINLKVERNFNKKH